MPKIPIHLQEKSPPLKPKCIACGGSGKSSVGLRCTPCQGQGVPYSWYCPKCNARHDGTKYAVCRNPKCPSNKGKK